MKIDPKRIGLSWKCRIFYTRTIRAETSIKFTNSFSIIRTTKKCIVKATARGVSSYIKMHFSIIYLGWRNTHEIVPDKLTDFVQNKEVIFIFISCFILWIY